MRPCDDDLTVIDFLSLGLIGLVLILIIEGIAGIPTPPVPHSASRATADEGEWVIIDVNPSRAPGGQQRPRLQNPTHR